MHHRPEIDGLRAVAVLPVILFHGGTPGFDGGFVGVDVFFVISGYLITRLIAADLDRGDFSIADFYLRRALRIIPALCLVILCTIPGAWFWMTPEEMTEFAASIIGVATFTSNIHFSGATGYFAPAAEEMPLLHTWSLAVEEQFYLVFPVAMILLWRRGARQTIPLVIGTAALSFAFANLAAKAGWEANYFSSPSRVWELLAGALCALIQRRTGLAPSTPLALSGLALIGVSVLVLDRGTPFPSVYTALPVAGTALVILCAAPGTLAARVLSAPALVFSGLLSYSAYLWHYPLFAFAHLGTIGAPAPALLAVLGLASFALAAVTWRCVEQPLRRLGRMPGRQRTAALWTCAALPAALFAFGIAGMAGSGFPDRFGPDLRAALDQRPGDTSPCHNRFSAAEIASGGRCVIGAPGTIPTIAVIGDSHAARITDALAEEFAARGLAAVAFNGSWCAPLMGLGTDDTSKSPDCREKTEAAFARTVGDPALTTVVLFAQWSNYTEGYRGVRPRHPTRYSFAGPGRPKPRSNAEAVTLSLEKTLALLSSADRDVILVGPTPELPFHAGSAFEKMRLRGAALRDPGVAFDSFLARNTRMLAILDSLVPRFPVRRIDPSAIYCRDGFCPAFAADGRPLFEDTNHLSYLGSRPLAKEIVRHLSP